MKSKRLLAAACAAFAIAAHGAKFTHDMPATTNEKPTNPTLEELATHFADASGKVRTGAYWYWLDGNISVEGIRKDLEAMKREGIDRAYIGDIGGYLAHGKVNTLSKEWYDALAAAFEKAAELGVEIGVFNSPGWSMSGGPWVGPEQTMRRFAAESAVVEGPCKGAKIPQPKFERADAKHYRDLMVVAYPLPEKGRERIEAVPPQDGSKCSVELEADEPFTAQSAVLSFEKGAVGGMVRVEASIDGKWKTICEMPFTRANHGAAVGFLPHCDVLCAFAPTTARKFRISTHPHRGSDAKWTKFAITGEPLLARAYEKSLAKMFEAPLPPWNYYMWPGDAKEAPGTALDVSKAIVMKDVKFAADGSFAWDAPAGKWLVYRIGCAPTGITNGPATREATGFEVDKMNRAHVLKHFADYMDKILANATPEARKAVKFSVLDSYEKGSQNWTDDFVERFKAAFGYDPRPYIPAAFGMAAGSRDESNRFLWDLRRFVADEVAYSYVGGLREACAARGMKTWLENYGHWGFPGEFLQYGGQSDYVAGEYWSEGTLGDIENRAATSCAHTYGKREVWCESNTCAGRPFSRAPADLKQRTDRFFAEGINASLLHLYIHQPDERKPGFTAWFGNEFQRHNTWFGHMDMFTGYLKRCNYILQQGLYVADIAYFIGEDAPKMTGITDPAPPKNRQFDYINAEVLRETATVDAEGRITLPHGTKYEVLVLPKLDTMRPEMVETVARLVEAGAFVLGPKPSRSPSLAGWPAADAKVKEIADRLWGEVDGKTAKSARRGKGTIAWGLSLDEVFAMRSSPADCAAPAGSKVAWCHRTMPNQEIYFVANQKSEPLAGRFTFRGGKGRGAPRFWNPVTGERVAAKRDEWKETADGAEVELALAGNESVFVVFPADAAEKGGAPAVAKRCTATKLTGAWTLEFESDALHRGPAKPLTLENLEDLSKNADPAVRFYAGTVKYKTVFQAKKPRPGSRILLKFGKVRETGRVTLNGREIGGIWTAPYAVSVPEDALREGENTLEVEVCTAWRNRLVGDAALPAGERPTWMPVGNYKADDKLKEAGLMGDAELLVESPDRVVLDKSVMDKKYWDVWNDKVQAKIDADIERFRKTDAETAIDAPDGTEVAIEQTDHAFYFGAHVFNYNQLGRKEWNDRYKNLYGTLFNSGTVAFYWRTFEPHPYAERFDEKYEDTEEYWCREYAKSPEGCKEKANWRRPAPDPVISMLKSRRCRIHGHPVIWGNRNWHNPGWLWDEFCPESEKRAIEDATGVEIPARDIGRHIGTKDADYGKRLAVAWKKVFKKLSAEEFARLAPTFVKAMEEHFERRVRNLAAHCGSRVDSWDVVNESATDFAHFGKKAVRGEAMDKSIYGPMPADYAFKAFQWADRYFPRSARLNINEYNMGPYIEQIEDLLRNGAKIDIVGSQMHLFNPNESAKLAKGDFSGASGTHPATIAKRFATLAKAGRPIHLSEITITAPDNSPRGQMIQATIVRNCYRAWFSVEKMNGITWWNVVDGCGAPGEPSISGLFTRDMQPKTAYFVLDDLVNREWKTKTVAKVEGGKVAFRGFRGRYRLSWKGADGKTRSKTVDFI